MAVPRHPSITHHPTCFNLGGFLKHGISYDTVQIIIPPSSCLPHSSIDPYLLVIGLTQTCFEGSMYLFVFLWVPSLQEASLSTAPLPLGYIFSCFMVAMMLGSLLYTTLVAHAGRATPGSTASEEPLLLNAKLSSLVCAVSALAFAITIASRGEEHLRFWAFCVFEACVGLYYPVQGTLRGTLISNEHRATVRNLYRERPMVRNADMPDASSPRCFAYHSTYSWSSRCLRGSRLPGTRF